MNRLFLSWIAPPVAVCKYGCGDCYAAPVGVFWLTGLFALGYGMLGGPANSPHSGWSSVLLGLALWGVAAVGATVATRGSDGHTVCQPLDSRGAPDRHRDDSRLNRS
jgi:hypothetical protein